MNEETRSLEQVYRSAVRGLYARITSYYNYLYRRFGDEAIDMISEMSREYGMTIAERGKKSLIDRDISSVAGFLLKIFRTVEWDSGKISITSETPEEIVIKVEDCPLHFSKPEMCRAHTSMEKAVVEGLNPELTYEIGRSIPAGDEFCEHILKVNADKREK